MTFFCNYRTVNLISLGNYPDVDTHRWNYDAENAHDLVGTHVDYHELSLVEATLSDEWGDGVMHDDDKGGTYDKLSYELDGNHTTTKTDSSLSGNLEITLTDGSVITVEAVLIQTQTGDLFATDLLNGGTLDNLDI